MSSNSPHLWLRRIAIITVVLTLMPFVTAAVAPPVGLMSVGSWGLGAASGVVAIASSVALAIFAFRSDDHRLVRVLAIAILASVVMTVSLTWVAAPIGYGVTAMRIGLLRLATLVGLSVVIALCSRQQFATGEIVPDRSMEQFRPLALLTCLAAVGQYILGAAISYLGTGLHEHIGGSVILSVLCLTTLVTAVRSRSSFLIRPALGMSVLLLVQIGLGAVAWVAKFGFAATGYVAVQGSLLQTWTRSVHAVAAGLLVMTAVVYGSRLFQVVARQQGSGERRHEGFLRTVQEASERVVVKGGIA